MNKAIFLDRDGVINQPVFNLETNEYVAPWDKKDFVLCEGVIQSLKTLQSLAYKLFVVSNQPDYAKGKTSLENLKLVHNKMHSIFLENDIKFTDYYYCYHHPNGMVPEYSVVCECRKPGNLFLVQALSKYNLDISNSWMIGDRDIDILCGQSVGIKTIQIKNKNQSKYVSQSKPNYFASGLQEATSIIVK